MPRQVLSPNEIDALEKKMRSEEVLPLHFFNSRTNDGDLTTAAGGFSNFEADKDYAIVGVSMDAASFGVTTPLRGLCILSFSEAHVHTVARKQGDVILQMGFVISNSKFSNMVGNNVYLDRGRTIYAHLHNESATGSSFCNICVYLRPIYKQ